VIDRGGEAIRITKTETLGFQMTGSRRREFLDIANVNWPGSTSWTLYADGYRRGAELLVEQSSTHYETNTLVYPIVFLYRQATELFLKGIIIESIPLIGKPTVKLDRHDILPLWKECLSIVKKRSIPIPRKDIQSADTGIRKLVNLDPHSQAFHYPVMKDYSKRSIPKTIDQVDLKELNKDMQAALGTLRAMIDLMAIDVGLMQEFSEF
jgi:hypothetical protein